MKLVGKEERNGSFLRRWMRFWNEYKYGQGIIDPLASGDHNDTTDDLEGADESEDVEEVSGDNPVTLMDKNKEKELDGKKRGERQDIGKRQEMLRKAREMRKARKIRCIDKKEEKDKKVIKDKKDRKTARDSKLDESLNTVVSVVTKAQKESDQMFIAFEEKRLKLDETLLMMEDRKL